jgi:hypothetical protein
LSSASGREQLTTPPRDWCTRALDEAALRALSHDMAPSALWSLLLGVAEARAGARSAGDLMQQWQRDRFVAPSAVDARRFMAIDRVLFDIASSFEAVELSPLAPLAACTAVAPGSQNRVVATMRGTEVVSDPTNVMALECARRLADDPSRVHLRALDALEREGCAFGPRTLRLLSNDAKAALADRLQQRVREAHPALPIERAPLASAYYDGLRFMIDAHTADGERLPLIDGGAFDWLRRLSNNRKLVFAASALGTQLAAARFS